MNRLVLPLGLAAMLAVLVCFTHGTAQDAKAPPAKAVDLKVVKLAELKDAIKAQKGKVVVIDFWGTLCIPCMKEFHNLVKLHDKYHDKGVVCMSVSVDVLKSKDNALKFLQKNEAVITNFILDDEKKEWQDEWDIGAIPAVMVYDAAGKLHPFRNDADKQFTYADVEKLVQKLIAK